MILNSEEFKDMALLNEAFYGKPAEFKEIEKNLKVIIDMVKTTMKNPMAAVDINSMPEVKNIERLFTNFFKNDETNITFYSAVNIPNADAYTKVPVFLPSYNAFCFPSSISFFRKSKENKKLRKSKGLYINAFIDIGLIYAIDATPEEVLSLILHEIGHCFDASFFTFLSMFNPVFLMSWDRKGVLKEISLSIKHTAMGTLHTFLVRSKLAAKFVHLVNKLIGKVPFLNKILTDFGIMFTSIGGFLDTVTILNRIPDMIKSPHLLLMEILSPMNIFGYSGEKMADSFATSYGYGIPLSTALSKVDERKGLLVQDVIKKVPVVGVCYDFLKVTSKASTLLLDPHPDTAVRIISQLKKLKRDLNDPTLTPKLRKELEKTIADLEDYVENVYLNIKDDSNKGKVISTCWNYVMIKGFKGKLDFREWLEFLHSHEL